MQKYLRHLYPWFGLPEKIISDRNPQFTSHFGRALTQELSIQQNISTAFHPQTDGLTERMNQWVEQYLHLILANQKDWSTWLPVAMAVHNNLANVTMGKTPHELLIGITPPLSPEQQNDANNVLVHDQVQLLSQYRALAVEALNRKATIPKAKWAIGEQVWLEGKNLSLPYGSAKLASRCHGPFKIVKVVSSVAYELALPPQWKIHPVFHASLLMPYVKTPEHGPNFTQPLPDLIEGEEEWEVKTILLH